MARSGMILHVWMRSAACSTITEWLGQRPTFVLHWGKLCKVNVFICPDLLYSFLGRAASPVPVLTRACANAHQSLCQCSPGAVPMLIRVCANVHQGLCQCSPGPVPMLTRVFLGYLLLQGGLRPGCLPYWLLCLLPKVRNSPFHSFWRTAPWD